MPDVLERKLEERIRRKLSARRAGLEDGFKGNKVVNEVLDRRTVMTLYKMIKDGVIAGVNGAVSAGKESVLFWGDAAGGGSVALKIYLVSTSNFKRREMYMRGDPRFSGIRRGTRNVVEAWARKEFRNLTQCVEAGLPVPRPVHLSGNVLAMEFVGEGGSPARRLLESEVTASDYDESVAIIGGLYSRARLVHGDFSEYNLFKTGSGIVAFDLASAVDLRHPASHDLLRRDINNISRFFRRRGVPAADPDGVYGEITG